MIETPTDIYTARVDDSLVPAQMLPLIPVLSPLVSTSPPVSPYTTGLGNPYDKVMLAPSLESCQHGNANCPPTIVDDVFLRNANANLQRGRNQVRNLTDERLPRFLEPFRRFLLDNLTTTLRMEQARYEYITTRSVAPLKVLLDQYCSRTDTGLIRDLEEAENVEMRRELSQQSWHNAVWQCYRERSGKYPAQAWKQFVRQSHLRETATPKPEQP